MIKKIIKYSSILICLVFLFFFYFGKNIYKYKLTEKKELTEAQIEKFENDIKNGIEIDINEYVIKDKNYDNEITKLNTKISHMIDKGFKKIFEYFIKNIRV